MDATIRPVDAATASQWRDMRCEMGPDWLVEEFATLVREYLDTGRVQGLLS